LDTIQQELGVDKNFFEIYKYVKTSTKFDFVNFKIGARRSRLGSNYSHLSNNSISSFLANETIDGLSKIHQSSEEENNSQNNSLQQLISPKAKDFELLLKMDVLKEKEKKINKEKISFKAKFSEKFEKKYYAEKYKNLVAQNKLQKKRRTAFAIVTPAIQVPYYKYLKQITNNFGETQKIRKISQNFLGQRI
jgi:catalase